MFTRRFTRYVAETDQQVMEVPAKPSHYPGDPITLIDSILLTADNRQR
jgi:hypothetical protein